MAVSTTKAELDSPEQRAKYSNSYHESDWRTKKAKVGLPGEGTKVRCEVFEETYE